MRDELIQIWNSLTLTKRLAIIGLFVAVILIAAGGWLDSLRSYNRVRQLEREAARAEREAKAALEQAAKIAREKIEVEKKLTELEVKRDAKSREAAEAHKQTLDARLDYERALRNSRGDSPSTDELCRELAALGYPCQ